MRTDKGDSVSLIKRLRAELREDLGDAAPEVLNLWVDGNYPQPGMTIRAHVVDGDAEWIAEGSVPVPDWEEAYQRLLADALPKTQREE